MLFEQIGIEQNCYSAEEVHSLFFGHPYLTQLFAWSIRSGSTADEAKQAALALDGAYETHWERMKSEVQFLIGKNYELSEVLTVVFEVSNRQSYDPLNYKPESDMARLSPRSSGFRPLGRHGKHAKHLRVLRDCYQAREKRGRR